MNSSKNKKKRRNVVSIRCRKLSSTGNKSQASFLVTPAGNYRRRISALLKNNKTLALALQDIRCDLSTKQKLLDEYSGYLNNVMFARFKILEMYSTLKTFVKDFDETLLLLKVDNRSCLNVAVPTRTCRNFKNKMGKLVESTEEVTEADSMSVDKEILESANEMVENTSHQIISSNINDTPNVNCTSEELLGETRMESYCNIDKNDAVTQLASKKSPDERDKNPVNICDLNNTNYLKDVPECSPDEENTTSIQPSDTNHELESQLSTALCGEDSEDIIKIRAGKQVFPENLSPLQNEGSETPRLSTSLKLFIDLEATSEHNSNFSNENCTSSEESISKTLEKPSDGLSAVKHVRSKIPRIQDVSSKSRIKTNSSDIISGKKGTTKRKYVKKDTEELDSNSNRRKTYVIKDTKHKCNSELSVVLNRDLLDSTNISGETVTNIGMESGKNICSRKTFVVKPSDIQENIQNSPCDRRKTFVKKLCDVTQKSAFIKNRRGTVTLSEVPAVLKVNEDCADQSENLNVVNEELVKDKNDINLFTDNTVSGKVTSDATIDTSKQANPISIENYEKIHCDKSSLPDVNIPAKNHSEELQQDNVCLLLPIKPNNSNSEDENSKVKELNEKISCEFKDLQNIDAMGDDIEVLNIFGDDPNGTEIFLENKIEEFDKSNSKQRTRPRKHVSYKLQFESSESECESIPDPDSDPCFVTEVLPIKKTPIRRRISKSKIKKVFVFDAHERKSVSSKKYNGSKQKNFENVSKQSNASCQSNIDSIGNVGSENQSDDDIKNTENQKTIKEKEAFVVRDQICKSSSIQKADTTNNEKELMQNPTVEEIVKDRITKKYKDDNSGVKDGVTSALNVKNCIEHKIDILYSTEISHDNSQTGMSDKVLQEEEQNDCPNPQEKDLNPKCHTVNALCTSSKSSPSRENKKASKCQVRNKKCISTIDNAVDNIISKPKKSKKRISTIDNTIDDIISKPKRSKKKISEKKVCFQEKEISSQDTENCISNLIEQGCSVEKFKKCVKKSKGKVKSNLPCNETGKNTFLVHAEVHSPPLHLNMPETNIMNKENEEMLELKNFQVSVVLNDVFELENIDMFGANQVFHEGKCFSLKTPFLSNSSNIPLPEENNKDDGKSTICTARNDEEVPTRRTRQKAQNYKEPPLNKKMRR